MDSQKLLDDLFEGKEVNPPKQFLVLSAGKYIWCDKIYDISVDENGNPLPKTYYVCVIIQRNNKEVAYIMHSVDGWYNFNPPKDNNIELIEDKCEYISEPSHVMFG